MPKLFFLKEVTLCFLKNIINKIKNLKKIPSKMTEILIKKGRTGTITGKNSQT
jgi:hypothetical protein